MEVWSTFLTNLLENVCLVGIPLRQESKLELHIFSDFTHSIMHCTGYTHLQRSQILAANKGKHIWRARTLGGAYWTEHDGYNTFYCYIGEKMLDF